jgi:hypothetical protein
MIVEIAGISGMLLILFAFIMNQTSRWKDDHLAYDAFNAVGSGLLTIYSFMLSSWPIFTLNIVWMSVSVRDIYLDVRKVGKKKGHVGHKRR